MKVVHVSNSDLNGGAAIAALRINNALRKIDVDSQMLVQKKLSLENSVKELSTGLTGTLSYGFRFLYDELSMRALTIKNRGRFTFPYFGTDISTNEMIKNADIINLHWINGGFLSLKSFEKLKKINKPLVWTLHDMWAFTGGCHYNLGCEKYREFCNHCPSLKFHGSKDISSKIFLRKSTIFNNLNITFVACSNWLRKTASSSRILKDKNIINIPNPIDLKVFRPHKKAEARKILGLSVDKYLLLVGAMNLSDERKGFKYLLSALNYLFSKNQILRDKIELLTFGKIDKMIESNVPFKINKLGIISTSDKLVQIYNASDLYIAPSIQDNLPNTVLESIACGTPVVAFNIGGMSDLITSGENGYLVEPESYKQIAGKIEYLINNNEKLKLLSKRCREISEKKFEQSIVARQYKKLYAELI